MRVLSFFSGRDIVLSLIPTLLTVYGTLEEFGWIISAVCGFLILVFYVIFSIRKNITNYKKELAEILATGYFINFMDNLSRNLFEKRNVMRVNGVTKYFDLNEIEVRLYLPSNKSKLGEIMDTVSDSDSYDGIDIENQKNNSSFWVRGKMENGKLIIVDVPRTLFSVPKFVKLNLGKDFNEKASARYFSTFSDKIIKLHEQHDEDRILSNFKLIQYH